MEAKKSMASMKMVTLMILASILSINGESCEVKGIYWFQQEIFPPSAINTKLFTHVYYAFLSPNNHTYQLNVSNTTATDLQTFTSTLSPNLSTLISIGGASSDSSLFASIAATAASRAAFINSTITVARTFGFHGLDLDWEFPRTVSQMNDLAQLFKEWRAAISAEAAATCREPLLLTAAVYFSVDYFLSETTSLRYPVDSINDNLDWVNVMTYDLKGPWSNLTGPPAGLFDPKGIGSVSYGLKSWIRGGVIPNKVVMGLPLYGRSWELADPSVHGIGAPAIGPGPGLNGAMALFQVLDFNNETGANVVYDTKTASVYSYSGNYWIGYDDPSTVAVKVGFAQALSLRGYFFWAAGFDTTDWKISTQALNAWMLYNEDKGGMN